MRNAKKSVIIMLSAFLLLVGAFQYKEVFHQEYRSTNVPQTMAFFREKLHEDDYIIYNWKLFDFIYEVHWPPEKLVYMKDFDFSSNFGTVWFINTEWEEAIDWGVLMENDLYMELVEGDFGIEHNIFSILKIYR